MQLDRIGVLSGSEAATYQENKADQKQINYKSEIPSSVPFMSKGELIKTIEGMAMELSAVKIEMLRLKRQRTNDLLELGLQKEKIIALYGRINKESDYSPLKISAG